MSSELTMNVEDLVKELSQAKIELIKHKKILDKKDNHNYPISDKPFPLPESWTWVYLSDISIIQEGPGIRKYQYQDKGVQFLTVTNILEGSIDFLKSQKFISFKEYEEKYKHYTLNRGDIVTACSGASWGKSALYESDKLMILNTSTLRLRFFNDLGNNKYLYYLTKTDYFKTNLASHSTGQQPNYGYSHYSTILVPLPPLREQKQIVAILDEAFEAIEQAQANIEKNIENVQELFQSKLNDIFSQEGDGWEEKSLRDICDKTNNIKWKEHPNTEFKYIDLSSVSRETLKVGETKNVNQSNAPSRAKRVVKEGDVIFATTRPTLKRVTIIDKDLSNSICSTGFVVLRAKHGVNPYWIFYYILTSNFMDRMESLQKGASYPAVTDRDVKDSKLSIPLSKSIENDNVSLMNNLQVSLNNILNYYQQKLNNLEELKKSVLEKAFAGELTKN